MITTPSPAPRLKHGLLHSSLGNSDGGGESVNGDSVSAKPLLITIPQNGARIPLRSTYKEGHRRFFPPTPPQGRKGGLISSSPGSLGCPHHCPLFIQVRRYPRIPAAASASSFPTVRGISKMADGGEAAASAAPTPPPPDGHGSCAGWAQRLRAGLAGAGVSLWVVAGLGLLYALRAPLRLCENLAAVTAFLNSLTPKFYVALTGTSSLISGLIFIFEWWYFRKYGTSFIEQVSISHLRPLIGGIENNVPEPGSPSGSRETDTNRQNLSECKVWRNPLNLFRGAEYRSCATAYVLLAEEEATTIVDAEKLFRQALKAGETIYRRSQQHQHQSPQHEAQLRRDTNVLVYIKRRLAMCARKLGRIREAVKIMRDLMKEFPPLSMLNIHENLLESLLELQAYADVQAVLAKYDDISLPKSAAICYTAALLKTRTVSDRFSPETASRRGLSTAEINAVEAIHRAVEFNPHVPKYLLEMKSLILPPEHILKRGDSEAVAYAFFHLQHWKRIEGALNLLQCTWEGTFRMIPYPLEKGHLFYPYPSCTETADRELLPTFHHVSVYPKKELPFFIHFTAGLCSSTAMLALLTHQFPEIMGVFAKAVSMVSRTCLEYL
ncbi:suppressor of tumorigenicity 7 protein-like isoform X2 [Petaurus breviceps papuanus]|uniref:suppressor of tumorigenicity 7 protein-like isoform X2 n=1 Tax=Petaurus breviceps papuanus TaxID=3040969 RepID=UPI0036D9618B